MEPQPSSSTAVPRIAAVAAVLGFPLLVVDLIRRSHPPVANRLCPLPSRWNDLAPGLQDDERRIARHSAWIDVSDRPIVITLDDLQGRHFSLMAFDAWGDVVANLSSRCWPSADQSLTIVGPRWNGRVPERGSAVRAPGDGVWLISRVSRHPDGDSRGRLDEPTAPILSRVLPHGLEPIEPGPWGMASGATNAIDLIRGLAPEEFFLQLTILTKWRPSPDACYQLTSLLQRLRWTAAAARTGGWSGAFVQALSNGLATGLAMIRCAAENQDPGPLNAWVRLGATPDTPPTGALSRAARVWNSLGAPRAVDLLQFICDRDANGQSLQGTASYALHFPPGRLPRANAFWELSPLSEQPSDTTDGMSSAIGSESALTLEPDGGLRVLIQREPPAIGVNWLRPPPGDFRLAMRLHWPTHAMIRGDWPMPAVERCMPRSSDRRRPPGLNRQNGARTAF